MDVPSAPPPSQQQQPIVVIVQAPMAGNTTSDADHFKKFFPKRAVMAMSVAMIVAGVLSAILQITLIAWPAERYWYNDLSHIGQGIWCGVFFVLTGGLGVSAAQKPSTCGIVTLMVFSIISACMAVPHMTIDGIGIGDSGRSYGLGFAGVVMYSIMFVLGLAGGIISIVLSSYTCRAVCCRRTRNVGSVVYNPAASGAPTTQTIQLGGNNMDLAKLIATQQQQQQESQQHQQQPPSYNAVAGGNMYYAPSHQLDLERGGGGVASKEAANTDEGAGDTESLTGGGTTGENYQRFF